MLLLPLLGLERGAGVEDGLPRRVELMRGVRHFVNVLIPVVAAIRQDE
jgi:hypothetical protein